MIDTTICYIGGGSADWAVKLMRDLALQDEIRGELRLYDIDRGAAELNRDLGGRLFRHERARSSFAVTVADELPEALDGADVVIVSIEPGPTELREGDLEIPARYGILQTVGDTTGPGGALRAWRAVPVFVDFATQIARHAPDAWVINYTNPMTVCTAALFEGFPGIKAVGCCHEVPALRGEMTRFFDGRLEGFSQETADLDLDVCGINHFTFCSRMTRAGRDLLPELRQYARSAESQVDRSAAAADRRRERRWFDNDHLIAVEFLRRFDALGFAGDRHLAEFVPWFLGSNEELERYGTILTPYWWRKERNEARADRDPAREAADLTPSGEEGVDMIRALVGGTAVRTNVNVPNGGQIPWLPMGHPVETFARISPDTITPETPATIPEAARALVRRAADQQRLVLAASLERNEDLLLSAVLADPLVHLPATETEHMVREMLAHQASRE